MASLGLNIIVFFFFTYRWGISHRPLSGEKTHETRSCTELYDGFGVKRKKVKGAFTNM